MRPWLWGGGLAVLAAVLVLAFPFVRGCGGHARPSAPAGGDAVPLANSATPAAGISGARDLAEPATPPLLAYWDGGVYLLNIPPTLVVAVWDDGTIEARRDGQFLMGIVSPAEVAALTQVVKESGFCDEGLLTTVLVPDGPTLAITIATADCRVTRFYHGRDDWALDGLTQTSVPSRREVERFIAAWKRMRQAIDTLAPAATTPRPGATRLQYPRN